MNKIGFDNKKYLSGWLSPKGEFYGCDYRSHDSLARYVLHKETYQLEREGYIKINYEEPHGETKRYYILMGEKTIPTEKQIRYLYNTFGNDPDSWDEMLWSIRVKKLPAERRAKSESEKDKK